MTEYQKRSDSNDNLREILEFDPESGERLEDQSELRLIKNTRLAVPPEVQAAFVRIYSQDKSRVKIEPEKLLLVHDYKDNTVWAGCCGRQYFLWKPGIKKEYDFKVSAMALFNKSGNIFTPIEIALYGEDFQIGVGREKEYLRITLIPEVCCDFILSYRHLRLFFDNEESISETGFAIDREGTGREGYPLYELDIKKAELKELLNQMSLRIKTSLSSYHFKIKENSIRLKRVEVDTVKDDLLLPQKISRSQIIQKLFDPLTLENPVNTPPELDDSWRFANLLDVVGVKWERY